LEEEEEEEKRKRDFDFGRPTKTHAKPHQSVPTDSMGRHQTRPNQAALA
jgi:hypothetical protein